MNVKQQIKQYGIYYIFGIIMLLGIKLFYSHAECEELKWILAPTARWVTCLSGIPFVYEPGEGYANPSLRLLIAPACSGVRFMMIVIATLLFSFVHRMGSSRQKCLCWTLGSIAAAYLLTILVNGLRILLAIYLPPFCDAWGLYGSLLNSQRLHTIIGAAVYFSALLTIHQLADKLTRKPVTDNCSGIYFNWKKALSGLAQPLFWYLSLVLGIPFLNKAYQDNSTAFTEYTALILLICTAVLFPVLLIRLTQRYHRRFRTSFRRQK